MAQKIAMARRGSGALGLATAVQGRAIKLTWKPGLAGVDTALRGVVSIVDGETQLDVPLSTVLLRGGSFWYSPRSDTVQLSLEVVQPEGKRIKDTATVRIGR